MTGRELCQKIHQLHQDSVALLEAEQGFPAFWKQFNDLFHEILESSAILASIIPNLDAFQRAVTAIQSSLEQEYQANLALKQALLRRQGEDDDGSLTFPEETLETYYEIMGRIFPSQHLDA